MRPAVSVLMNCLNGARYLGEALDSVCRQTVSDWEVLFWDDASRDGSAAIARSYGSRLRYFRGPGGQPLGTSRQLALGQAEGPYLAILDVDDRWGPQKLSQQLSYLDRFPAVGLLASDCWLIDAEGHGRRRFFERTPFPDTPDRYRRLLTGSNFLPAPTLVFRTDLVRRVGGFRPYQYAELYDLCLRVAQVSEVEALPAPLASYRLHAGNRGGAGCVGMTREVLAIMRSHRAGATLGQYVREGALRARLGMQHLYARA